MSSRSKKSALNDIEKVTFALEQLGIFVREDIRRNRSVGSDGLLSGSGAGDFLYNIDLRAEAIIVSNLMVLFERWLPLDVICEGIGADGYLRVGGEGDAQLTIMIDPIDGTRPLMYDKRSAWFIAAAGPGGSTHYSDLSSYVVVELPTTKQLYADTYSSYFGGKVEAKRYNLFTGEVSLAPLQPSAATTIAHGFGQVSDFFTATMPQAAALSQRIVLGVLGPDALSKAIIFNDQYLSTGGQMVELMAGRDRFCCDLRPMFHKKLERDVTCSPDCYQSEVESRPFMMVV